MSKQPKMGSRATIVYNYLTSIGGEARYTDLVDNCAPFSPFGTRFRSSGRRACQGFDQTLKRMVDNGVLEKPERGLYRIVGEKDARKVGMSALMLTKRPRSVEEI